LLEAANHTTLPPKQQHPPPQKNKSYNATLFAYGQTGSGKTFTIAGGVERYSDRGVAPRALAALYEGIAARPGRKYQVW
jgi:kinesin family protein 6/9